MSRSHRFRLHAHRSPFKENLEKLRRLINFMVCIKVPFGNIFNFIIFTDSFKRIITFAISVVISIDKTS